jgi:small conductance mechanosensitive channel
MPEKDALTAVWPSLVQVGTAALAAGVRIALTLLLGWLAVRAVCAGIRHLEALMVRAGEPSEAAPGATRKRVATLTGLLRTVAVSMIWATAAVIVLGQLGLDVTPILAGAGILGLAVGFGAQNLVRDVLTGFFLVLENHVRVGDVAVINGTGGLVESITYRVTVLRDLAGVVHVFPNGSIDTLSNMTLRWSAYLMDIGVAYKEDTDRVVEVMKRVAEELRADPELGPKMLGPLEVFGVDEFADSAVVLKARIRTQPIEQWTVGREYRRRLKKAFDAEGIEIPFPHLSLYAGEATKPLPLEIGGDAAGARADRGAV